MRNIKIIIVIILGLLLNFPLSARDDIPQQTADGLQLLPDTQLRLDETMRATSARQGPRTE